MVQVHPKGLQVHVRRPKGVAYTALGVEPLRCGVWGEPFITGCQRLVFGFATAHYRRQALRVKQKTPLAACHSLAYCFASTSRLRMRSVLPACA